MVYMGGRMRRKNIKLELKVVLIVSVVKWIIFGLLWMISHFGILAFWGLGILGNEGNLLTLVCVNVWNIFLALHLG